MTLAIVLVVRRREYARPLREEFVLLIPAITVLILVSSQTGFNRYLRYVLPAVPFLYIFASRAGKAFELLQPLPRFLCGAGLAASIMGSLSVYPHSMSYFNLAAGGALGGPAHLLDANLDWRLVPESLVLARSTIIRPFVVCGRYPLVGYCAGGVLSILGEAALSAFSTEWPTQLLLNLVGWGGCLAATASWGILWSFHKFDNLQP